MGYEIPWPTRKTEEKLMAGSPTPHGNGWRIKWTNPDTKLRHSHPAIDEDDAKDLRTWLESHGDRVAKTDPALVRDTWRTGVAPQPGKAYVRWTFGKWAEHSFSKRETLATTEVRYVANAKRHFAEWWDLPIGSITQTMVKDKKEALKETAALVTGRKLSAKTRAGLIVMVAGLFRDAAMAGIIKRNPFHGDPNAGEGRMKIQSVVSQPRVHTDEQIYVPRTEWQKVLLAAAAFDAGLRPGWRQTPVALQTMVETGCRAGEFLACQVKHAKIDLAGVSTIDVKVAWRYEGGRKIRVEPKRGSVRTVAISRELAEALLPFLVNADGTPRSPDAALFPAPYAGDRGWSIASWRKARWQKVIELAKAEFGLDPNLVLRPHGTRHAHITWLLNDGVSKYDVSLNVGHKNTSIIEGVYGRKDNEHAARMAAHITRIGGFGPDRADATG